MRQRSCAGRKAWRSGDSFSNSLRLSGLRMVVLGHDSGGASELGDVSEVLVTLGMHPDPPRASVSTVLRMVCLQCGKKSFFIKYFQCFER